MSGLQSAPALTVAPTVRVVEEHGTVYLIPRGGRPLRLNRLGSMTFRALIAGRSIEHVVTAYAASYATDRATAAGELEAFVDSLVTGGFLIERPDA